MSAFEPSGCHEAIEHAAAQWVMRSDRGLTAAEQDELSTWLAADPRHGEALARQRWTWDELDRVAGLQASLARPDPDLVAKVIPLRPTRAGRLRWLAAAAALALLAASMAWHASRFDRVQPALVQTALAAPCERLALEDGTEVECNRGALVEVAYSGTERRVRLIRGEANFRVAKDPNRPFHVTVGEVTLRAVGTVFNVRLGADVVDVVVREGAVLVSAGGDALAPHRPASPVLVENQRAQIPHRGSTPPAIATLSEAEVDALLAWQPRLLDFTDAPLAEIVATFNRHNVVRVSLGDDALDTVRLSATFRSDNVQGFLRLIASEFGIRAAWQSDTDVVLQRAE